MRAKEFIVEANSKQPESARQKFLNKVIGPESGGNVSIKNPRSSATGLFQFIKSTWDNTVAKAKPGDPHYGVSFNDMKKNPAAQRAAADQISREYQAAIQKNNLPDTPGMYYLFHGHGAKAIDLYNNPDKQLKDIYDPYARDKQGKIIYNPKTGKPVKSIIYKQNPNFDPEEKISTFIAGRAAAVGDNITNIYPDKTKLAVVTPTSKTTKTDTTTNTAQTTDKKITPSPVVAQTTKEPDIVSQYVDVNKGPGVIDKVKKTVTDIVSPAIAPKTAKATTPEIPKTKPEFIPGTPEYDARMEKQQIAAGEKFSKEREARLAKERDLMSKKLPMSPPSTDPELDPQGWKKYDDYMEKLQSEKGDKYHQEYMDNEKKLNQTSSDDSYYTKFKNLLK
jgi:hypothetical protein